MTLLHWPFFTVTIKALIRHVEGSLRPLLSPAPFHHQFVHRPFIHKDVGPSPPQISLLKQSLEMQLSQSQSSLQQLQHQFSQEREHLRMQLDELQTEHKRRQQHLQETHHCALQDLEHVRQHDLKVGGGAESQAGPSRCWTISIETRQEWESVIRRC